MKNQIPSIQKGVLLDLDNLDKHDLEQALQPDHPDRSSDMPRPRNLTPWIGPYATASRVQHRLSLPRENK